MIYANNAGTSWPKPLPVREAVAAALEADPRGASEQIAGAARRISEWMGVRHPERLLFTPGCTSALAVAVRDLPWREGDAVVTSSLEHHALIGPVESLARTRGVQHRAAPRGPGDCPIDLDFVRDALREGNTRLVAVSAASNVTGECLPLKALADLAHESAALLLVDAAQAAGVVGWDLERLAADIVVFAGHKAPLGPQGVGVLWAAPRVEFESPFASCEVADPSQPPACNPYPDYCDVGGANLAAIAGLDAGVQWLQKAGAEPGEAARELARQLIERLRADERVRVFGGADVDRSAAVSIAVEGLALDVAEAHFARHGIVVRAGQHCAPMATAAIGAPAGTIRISFGPFNEPDDVEAIVAAVEAVA